MLGLAPMLATALLVSCPSFPCRALRASRFPSPVVRGLSVPDRRVRLVFWFVALR